MHIDNTEQIAQILFLQQQYSREALSGEVQAAAEKELLLRLSWNTNHLEGNTLSLDETIEVLEYDEVESGHTYSEYKEAKTAYRAYKELLDFQKPRRIDLPYISKANAIIMDSDGNYRTSKVYIGTLAESAYTPPAPDQIPGRMQSFAEKYFQNDIASDKGIVPDAADTAEITIADTAIAKTTAQTTAKTMAETIACAAGLHMDFEQIHPFRDGNGRTGRLFLNQFLLNQRLLPAIIGNSSRYRQAFRYYEQSEDTSVMEHCIVDGILQSYHVLQTVIDKLR